MLALIDGDIIVYSVGFFNDISYYLVNGEMFQYKRDAKAYCKKHGYKEESIAKVHKANPVDQYYEGIDVMVDKIKSAVSSNEAILYLTGKGNFREEIAVTAPYKGNRENTAKPYHFDEMREYLISKWNAELIEGMEADDAMGIRQTLDPEEDTVICSIDKDLLMIPGNHYNWRKETFTQIDELTGWRNFYEQMLKGDSTDNIIGLPRVGDKTATKMLMYKATPEEMCNEVITQYKKYFGDSWSDRLSENASLLYIRRHNAEQWKPH